MVEGVGKGKEKRRREWWRELGKGRIGGGEKGGSSSYFYQSVCASPIISNAKDSPTAPLAPSRNASWVEDSVVVDVNVVKDIDSKIKRLQSL